MTTELESHGGEQLVPEVSFSSRHNPLVKRGAQTGAGVPSSTAAVMVHRPADHSRQPLKDNDSGVVELAACAQAQVASSRGMFKGNVVTSNYLGLLGAQMALGRVLQPKRKLRERPLSC